MGDAYDDAYTSYVEVLAQEDVDAMRSEDYVYVHCDYITMTADAVLIAQNGENYWIPRSCLAWNADRNIPSFKKGDRVTIGIKQWLAEKKELEYD